MKTPTYGVFCTLVGFTVGAIAIGSLLFSTSLPLLRGIAAGIIMSLVAIALASKVEPDG
jgi:hypothetical protein